jgi:hypothetical protein
VVFVFCLQADGVDADLPNTNKEEKKESPDFNSGVKDFEGSYCGFGLNIGAHRISATGNREFKNVSESAYSTTIGGVAAVGYQKAVCGNFFLGGEAGVDFGSGPKKLRVGGELNENSAGFHYLQRQYALSRLINSYFRTLSIYGIPAAGASATGNVWRNFLRVNRYLGGATNTDIPGLVNQDGTPGPAISAFVEGNYSPLYVNNGNNPNATYSSFIGQETVNSLLPLGNGNMSSAMTEIRNFITFANSELANILRSIAETDVFGTVGSSLTGATHPIDAATLRELAVLFSGDEDHFADIGITNANAVALFGNDIERVNNAIIRAINDQSLVAPQHSAENIKTDTTFRISPYIAAKAGYFFNEIKACLYVKAGVMHLGGQIVPANNFYTVRNDKFRKIAPFFAIGLSKNFNENFGINIELSKTLKISKEITLSTPYGHRVNNKVKVNKINFAVVIVYRF